MLKSLVMPIEMNEKAKNWGLLILRVSAGGLMLLIHGWPKLMIYGQKAATFPDPLGLGSSVSLALVIFAELFCAAFIVAGLATRIVAIPLIFNFLVAGLVFHGADPLAKRELALFYLAVFVVIFLLGPGKYSGDAYFQKRG